MKQIINRYKYFSFKLGEKLFKFNFQLYYWLYTFYKNFSDSRERSLLRHLVRPNMHVVDIGANIGINSKYYSKMVGPNGFVYAFEPDVVNFNYMKWVLRKCKNIHLVMSAVGSYDGATKLFLSSELNVDHCTFDTGDSRKAVDINIVSLDNYFKHKNGEYFVKIDVQGAELDVLKGAYQFLQNNEKIYVLFEFSPYCLARSNTNPESLLEFVRSLNFILVDIESGREFGDWHHLKKENVLDYCNLLAVRGRDNFNEIMKKLHTHE